MFREVLLDSDGFAKLFVDIRPLNSTILSPVRFKVDTGANRTTISRDELARLGYDEHWIKRGKPLFDAKAPTTASGLPIEGCYEIILPEIRIGDWVGYNWPFLTSLSVQFKFLLGTDSMRFFKWTFDYEDDVCRFELIPGRRRILFNQLEQAIHAVDSQSDGIGESHLLRYGNE